MGGLGTPCHSALIFSVAKVQQIFETTKQIDKKITKKIQLCQN